MGDHCPVACGMLRLKQRELCSPFQLNVHLRRQYAYDPSRTSQQQGISGPQQGTSYQQQTRGMLPPPTPVPHGKASGPFAPTGAVGGIPPRTRGQLTSGNVGQAQQRLPADNTLVSTAAHHTSPLTSNPFTPRVSTSHLHSSSNARFVPQTPRFAPAGAGTRVHSRAGNPNPVAQSGQRAPFYPGTRMG